jgi:hypothetical protein
MSSKIPDPVRGTHPRYSVSFEYPISKVDPMATEAPAEPVAPKAPADPRLKVLKKFHGKFLPKGVLRERHKAIMTRWNSGEDHGDVTLDELKTLLSDWRGTREKPPRMPKA